MSSNWHHKGSTWPALPPALDIPYGSRGAGCLKRPSCTHPNVTGSDELIYSGENIWPMRDGSWQIVFLLCPCRCTLQLRSPRGHSGKIKQLVRHSSSQWDKTSSYWLSQPHSPFFLLLLPRWYPHNRIIAQKPLPQVLLSGGTRLRYDQISGAKEWLNCEYWHTFL